LKICIISGPHRPGKCGISDYVDLLDNELTNRKYITQRSLIESPNDFFLISKDLPEADFYIIQFAPYSFSSSGYSGNSILQFASALSEKKVIVNFHEIWIGAYPKAKWKESLIGWKQKREILKFLELIKPNKIHSTNAAAIDRLKKEGVNAEFMYLFGNIPYSTKEGSPSNSRNLKVAFFGTLYESFPYELLGHTLSQIAELLSTKIELRIIGRQRDGNSLSKLIKMGEDKTFLVSETKELSPDEISQELQASSIGVSTTPFDIIGKSGATAAMLEHGLPILSYDDGDTPKESLFVSEHFQEQTFLLNDPLNIKRIIEFIKKPKKVFCDGVAHTTDKMLETIS
jgi:glycosyltransferase involved in cell wall biosynthesis